MREVDSIKTASGGYGRSALLNEAPRKALPYAKEPVP